MEAVEFVKPEQEPSSLGSGKTYSTKLYEDGKARFVFSIIDPSEFWEKDELILNNINKMTEKKYFTYLI